MNSSIPSGTPLGREGEATSPGAPQGAVAEPVRGGARWRSCPACFRRNLIVHQWLTDARRSRGWLGSLWALCGLQLVLAYGAWPLPQAYLLELPLAALYGFLVAVLLIRLMHADPWVGTNAWWMTRPMRRFHLFVARAAFAFGLILLPQMMLQALFAVWHGFTAAQLLQAAAEVLLYSTVVIATVGAAAALSQTWVELVVVAILSGLWLGLTAALVDVLQRFGLLPWNTRQILTESQAVSVVVATLLVYTLTVLGTWICQGLTGRRRRSALLLAAGLAATVMVAVSWRYDFLEQPAETTGEIRLAPIGAAAVPPDRSECSLWNAFRIEGLATNQFLVVRSAQGILDTSAHGLLRIGSTHEHVHGPWPFFSSQGAADYSQVIRRTLPPETVWRGTVVGRDRRLILQGAAREPPREPMRGVLTAQLVVDRYAAEKLVDIPLRPGSKPLLPGETLRVLGIAPDSEGITVRLWQSTPSLLFGREDRTGNRLFPYLVPAQQLTECVIYHPGLQEAFLVSGSTTSLPSLLGQLLRTERTIRIPYPALRARLTGATAADWIREARLLVFRPRHRGVAHLDIDRAPVTLAANDFRYSHTPTPPKAGSNP